MLQVMQPRQPFVKSPSICFASLCALVVAMACAGCHSPSQYSSPRIVGRVVDERTQQPIKGVNVRRGSDAARPMEPPKGGERMVQPPPVYTGADGEFVLQSARALAFIRRLQWYSVTLTFSHPGYERATRSYSLSDSTNTAGGEPLIQTGDITLTPSGK